MRLFYAADAFVEYHRIDETSYYAGVNGAGGVLSIESLTEGEHSVQVYVLHDQAGNEITFFGHSGVPDGASGQLWKYTVAKGTRTGVTEATAYVGNLSLPYTAAHDGYENGRIVTAFDSAGRKFVYTYTSVGSVDRLTNVVAQTGTSSPVTLAQVDYAYYGQSSITTGTNNGTAGDLAMIRVTLPTSFGASGSLAAIDDVRENRFYYDGSSRLKLVLGYEGTRRHLVDTAGSPVSWNANATTLAAALNGLAELRVSYQTSSPFRAASVWFDGMDGGSGSSPNGQHDIAYEHTAYATPWSDRTVVKLPAFKRFNGTTLSSPSETTASSWSTQYFDDIGQPLSSVVSDIDPATTSATPRFWITGVERDSLRRLIALNSAANCTGYNHNATSATRGTFTRESGTGLVTYFERYGSSDGLEGLVKGVRRGTGVGTSYGSTSYVSSSVLALREPTPSWGTSTIKLRKPYATATRVYPTATTNINGSGTYNETTYTYGWWGTTVVPQWIETKLPAVSAANNGTGVSDTRQTWFSHVGQAIVTRLPNKRLDTSEYNGTTGLLVRQTTDAVTPTSTTFGHFSDLPVGIDAPTQATIGQEAAPYKVVTEYFYDTLGRTSQTIANPSKDIGEGRRVSQSYYTRLSDRRLVRLDVPAVDDTSSAVYCGPVSAAVINHVGLVEEAGQICLSDPTVRNTTNPSRFTTTASPRTWLAEPGALADDCLAKAQHGNTAGNSQALVSYALSLTSPDGSRVIESRRYTSIPTTGTTAADFRGSANTSGNNNHFDYTLARYNALGLPDRTEDFTRTVDVSSFDVLGRVVQRSRGVLVGSTDTNMRVHTSVVYDAANYGTYTSGNLNVEGRNGNVTQVFQHPSGAFNGSDDIHSYVRYDGLDNAVNVWRDAGPFLASAVDNLGRTVSAAAFDGTVADWNASGPAPTATSFGSGHYRQRFGEVAFDERGRTFRRTVAAINGSTGVASTVAGDTTTSDTYWGANDVVKGQAGAATQLIARDRLCQIKSHMSVVATTGEETQAQFNTQMITADPTNAIVVGQTNYYRDPTHMHVTATVTAQRGTADVSVNSSGGIVVGSATPTFGPLMDIPGYAVPTSPPVLDVDYNTTLDNLEFHLRSGTASNLLLDVRTTAYDGLLLLPTVKHVYGDMLRHDSLVPTGWDICCGLTECSTDPLPSGIPYIEERQEYDPRYIICKVQTTDWESGERTTVARSFNAAGQLMHTMRARKGNAVTPAVSFPDGAEPLVPTSGPGCCGETERTDNEWDKGRLKMERMFLCDPPSDADTFNPLSETHWSGCANNCPKTTSYGFLDFPPDIPDGAPSGFYPWNASNPPTHTPNDNNLPLWIVRPIGANPDTAWHRAKSNGDDDADWYTYDNIGRPTRSYLFPYRKSNFGDGNPVPSGDAPARHTLYGPGGYPSEVRTPSGDHLFPWERLKFQRDGLGRPLQIAHFLGDFAPTGTPTPNDVIDLTYDRFGLPGSYGQTFDGMFPSGCGASGPVMCGLEREGTPQQDVKIGDRVLRAWQGPRVVRQTLPVSGMEVGMAYFPDPTQTDDSLMYPTGSGGYSSQLVEPRLNWALGRPMGIYQGNGTDHYDTPLTRYEYAGVAKPLYRSMLLAGSNGMDVWPGLPTHYAPVGNPPSSGTPMSPLQHQGPDWRGRTRNDVWRPGIDASPTGSPPFPYRQWLEAEGPKEIIWCGSHLISLLDPASSPDFASGSSPVADFTINGHDEFTRYDCNGRPIYWASGQFAGKGKSPTITGPFQDAQNAWLNGRTSPTGANTAEAAKPGLTGTPPRSPITEVEFRWPSSPSGCGSSGPQSGWLMAPSGRVNVAHPLSPNYGTSGAPAFDEWGQHDVLSTSEGCSAEGINNRTAFEQRKMTSGTSVTDFLPGGGGATVSTYPRTFTHDAAGNVRFDGRHFYQYDGSNRLKDVYRVAWPGGVPTLGFHKAHFDYDGPGRLIKSLYDTDNDGSLSDEDAEWTPRDHLGRPIGIWRQGPSGGAGGCAKPYQLFGYHNTSFRGEGSDDARGILDAPAVRWRDLDGGGTLKEVTSYLQDFRGDVRAVTSSSGGILEHTRYGLTGRPESFPAADVNFDGQVDSLDEDNFAAAVKQYKNSASNYDPRADLNRDGTLDSADESLFSGSYSDYTGYGGQWKLSSGAGLMPGHSGEEAGLDNRFGWRGYWYDPRLQMYHVRNRAYDPRQGQWLQTDPLGFSAGDQNLYRYADGNYASGYDPTGLRCVPIDPSRPENGYHCDINLDGSPPACGDDVIEGLENFHGPSGGDWLDNTTSFFAGYADALTFGTTARLRDHWGQSDFVNRSSGWYTGGMVTGAVVGSAVLGGAGAQIAIANWGLRAGSAASALVGGATAGVVGDMYFQGSMIANGMQEGWDPTQTLAMGALGGGLGVWFHGVVDLLRTTASVDMVAARAALAADEAAQAARAGTGGTGGGSGATNGACGSAARAISNPGPGEDLFVGTYGRSYRANVRTGLNETHTPHHAVQDAVSSTSRSRGATINIRQDLHEMTRSFSQNVDLGSGTRNLAADIRDLRIILRNAGYDPRFVNQQMRQLIDLNRQIGNIP